VQHDQAMPCRTRCLTRSTTLSSTCRGRCGPPGQDVRRPQHLVAQTIILLVQRGRPHDGSPPNSWRIPAAIVSCMPPGTVPGHACRGTRGGFPPTPLCLWPLGRCPCSLVSYPYSANSIPFPRTRSATSGVSGRSPHGARPAAAQDIRTFYWALPAPGGSSTLSTLGTRADRRASKPPHPTR